MISDEQKASAIAALNSNSNARAIARELGLSKSTVERIAQLAKIDLIAGKKKGGRLLPETYARIFAELHAYPNAKAVAKKIGCSNKTVAKVAKRAGIELNAGRGRPSRRDSMKRDDSKTTRARYGQIHDLVP